MRFSLLLLALSGCSFSRFDYTECTTNDECKSAFGWDSVCGGEGYCEELEMPERCATTYPADLWTNRDAYDDAIVLGALYYLGYTDEVRALELPLRQVNGENLNGGLDGQLFALIECDDADYADGGGYSDSLSYDEAVTTYTEWLVDSVGVPAILGPDGSGATEAAWLTMQNKGLTALLMTPASTSPALTYLDGAEFSDESPGLIWRTAPSDSLQGKAMAQYLSETLLYDNVAIIYPGDSYGLGLKGAFFDEFSDSTHTVASREYQDSTQMSGYVSSITTGAYDAVIFLSSPGSVSVQSFLATAETVAAFSDGEMPIVLADGGYSPDIYNSDDSSGYSDLFDQIVGTVADIDESGVTDDFRSSFSSTYGAVPEESNYPVYAYDASWLVLVGAAWSYYQEGSVSPLGIGRGLRNVSDGAAVDLTRNAWNTGILNNFKSGQSIDITGATGPLDYDPETGETTAPILVWSLVETDGVYDFQEVDNITPDLTE